MHVAADDPAPFRGGDPVRAAVTSGTAEGRGPVTCGALEASSSASDGGTLGRAAEGFLAAVQLLTRVPVPRGRFRLELAVAWLPAVGLLLGSVLAVADLMLRAADVAPLVESTLLVVLLLGLTGALHADGLMDTCDAVFCVASPARRLEIMRDPRAGAFGVVGLVSVFALKVAAIDALPANARLQLVILAPTLGRWAIVVVATLFPYGRQAGLGAPLKAAATPRNLVLASALPLIVCAASGVEGLAIGALAALTAVGVGRWLTRLLPGLTGDCYGAVCEVVETVVWLLGGVSLLQSASA